MHSEGVLFQSPVQALAEVKMHENELLTVAISSLVASHGGRRGSS